MARKRIPLDQDRMLLLHRSGKISSSIASELGVSEKTVRNRLRELGAYTPNTLVAASKETVTPRIYRRQPIDLPYSLAALSNRKLFAKMQTMPAPECLCGCGEVVGWSVFRRTWADWVIGHNATVSGERRQRYCADVDPTNPTWCYLLGALHGDGCDSRKIDIAVSNTELGWGEALSTMLREVGLSPYDNVGDSIVRVQASCASLAKQLLSWKPGGRDGVWRYPLNLGSLFDYLAGLIDSDGTVSSKLGTVAIYQRDNGNLEKVVDLLRAAGEDEYTLSKYVRQPGARINGRLLNKKPHVQVSLNIRGTLRDRLFPYLRNPNRVRAWRTYRTLRRPLAESYPRPRKRKECA